MLFSYKNHSGVGLVVHACNPSLLGDRDRKGVVQGQPGQG
jgi:hypothetical protein